MAVRLSPDKIPITVQAFSASYWSGFVYNDGTVCPRAGL